MDFNQVFNERFRWQKQTVKKIKDLLCFSSENDVNLNQKSKNLAIVYGFPQVGKTTLILNLMGIKKEYVQEVYDVLRAGIHRGNSSTSTSIFYCKSEKNTYGIMCKNLDEKSQVKYCEKEELKERLKKVREDVEKNIKRVDILNIYIPASYFEENRVLDILDTPGVDSRNKKEERHLRDLMNRFLSVANVTMIVCNANEIQSLENKLNYLDKDWKYLNKEYIVVVTHSYSQASVSKYFSIYKNKRKQSFDEFIQDIYAEEIKKVLGKGTKMEIFPIEVGDSLQRLLDEHRNDKEEIQRTVEVGLKRIRDAVNERGNNSLKTIINNMKSRIELYIKELIENTRQDILSIGKEIEELKENIEKKEKNFKYITDKYKLMVEERAWYEKTSKIYEPYIEYGEFEKLVDEYLVENFWGDCKYFKDSSADKEFYCSLRVKLEEKTQKYMQNNNATFEKLDMELKAEVIDEEIFNEEDSTQKNLKENILSQLYPGGFFLFREKIEEKKAKEVIKETVDVYREKLFEKIRNEVNKRALEEMPDERKIRELECAKQVAKLEVQKLNVELKEKEKRREEYKEESKNLVAKEKHDTRELENYIELAKSEYRVQYNAVVEKINLKSTTYDEKMLLTLFLGLMEKDYNDLESEEFIL